ncbi:LOW QUALITY PROTEIN: reverse transcriptase [Phytophthora megakarya]|uniref:Reverse transcriptase n=1 Tax=Phytophthora megakarya TaxID=4795 RepID=A0A225WQ60_9STRA|nr:LOW QUALITY PROTEIN: reverse transcriptase [Phytophthora megakarya]
MGIVDRRDHQEECLTQLMVYPMPLINDLQEDLESTLWYCSLDMASGFWLVKMMDRAPLISAFITPFRLFEWNGMPFGLKNAPQINQRMINNALYGFTRIPKTAGDLECPDIYAKPENLKIQANHRSYIDDILVPEDHWDQLCDRVEGLLETVVKSLWGMPKVEYFGHKVSHDGLEANPKDLSALTDLGFPGSLRFIDDYAIYASVLSELRAIDYAAMGKGINGIWIQLSLASESPDPDISFKVLKEKIAKTPILHHFDPDRQAVAIVNASDLNDLRFNALQGRLGQWAAPLSPWILETVKCNKGEDEILGTLTASITPRSKVDKALILIAPKKEPRRKVQPRSRQSDEDLYVASFDGSARVKRCVGAYIAIL